MALRIAKTNEISHDEWLKCRINYIGGSESASAVGINPWKSPVRLWLIKTGQIEDDDLSDNEAVQIGKEIEAFIAQLFVERTGIKVRRDNFMYQHPEYQFMSANVDRVVIGENIGVEIKNVGIRSAHLWEGDELPDIYFCQIQHYCAVMGWEGVHVAALIAGNRFVSKYVPRNNDFIQNLIETEAAFWQHVVNKTMPAVDGSEDCSTTLKKMFPGCNGQTIALPDIADLWVKQYQAASADEEAAKLRKEEAKNALSLAIGENLAGMIGRYTVTLSPVKGRETFDKAKFTKDYPGVYDKYIKIGAASKRFAIKEEDGN